MRMISCSTSRLMRGLPGPRRAFEPSNLRATSLRYQPRMVSGRAMVATSARAFAAQPMTDLAERLSLGVREFQPPPQLRLEDAVLGRQVFIPRQQLLVHRPGHVGQDARPIHCRPLPHTDPRRRHLGPSGTVYHHQELRSDVANRLVLGRSSILTLRTPRWSDPPILHGQKLRRWTSHRPPLKNVLELAADHPAVVEGRTIFPSRVFDPADVGRVLVPGESSRKIGGYISKGAWKGSRIFTLSLEERASCPRSCTHWRTCYLNHMHFTKRLRHGPALVARIEQELIELTERHPEGVVIRAHISG